MRHILSLFLLIALVACAPGEKAPGAINNRDAGMPSPGASADQTAVAPQPGKPMPPMYIEPLATPTVGIPPSPPSPYDPKAEDARWMRGEVYLQRSDVLVLESYPPRYVLSLQGSLPTPCHQLRIRVQPPDAQNRVFIEVYSVADPNKMCIQVLQDFAVQYPLNLPPGDYTFWVNGEKVGMGK
jgi:hypothetical protein